MNLKKTTIMNIKKMDRVFVPDIENGKYWMECPDEISGEWLKPIKDVYVLEEKEYKELQDQIEFYKLTIRLLENKLNDPHPF